MTGAEVSRAAKSNRPVKPGEVTGRRAFVVRSMPVSMPGRALTRPDSEYEGNGYRRV
jgi:hypothetical protein